MNNLFKKIFIVSIILCFSINSHAFLNIFHKEKKQTEAEKALQKELENSMKISTEIYGNMNSLEIIEPIKNVYTVTIQENNVLNTFNIRDDVLYILDVGIKGNLLLHEAEQADLTKYSNSLMVKIPKENNQKIEVYYNGQKIVLGVKEDYSFELVYLVSNRSSLSKLTIIFEGMKKWKS